MTTNANPGDVVDAYFDAVAKNDVAAIQALTADDFVQYPPPLGAEQDRPTFIAEWEQRVSENPNSALVYERDHRILETIEDGPRTGEWVHEWGVYRRTDEQLAFKLNASFRLREGRLAEIRAYFDRLDVMSQGGYTLQPPTKN